MGIHPGAQMMPADAPESGCPLVKEEKISEESDQLVQDVGDNPCQQADAGRQKRHQYNSKVRGRGRRHRRNTRHRQRFIGRTCSMAVITIHAVIFFPSGPTLLRGPTALTTLSSRSILSPGVTLFAHGLLPQRAFSTHHSTQRRHQLWRGFLQLLKMMQRQLRQYLLAFRR